MYVEWWMALVILAWWFMSIAHITKGIRNDAFQDGVNQGTETTLKILQKEGIISINDNEEIISVKK
jgi:hypothetical protein